MTTDKLIQKIAHLQDTADRRYFPEGIFESYRSNKYLRYHRPDTNVFFTAITVFILNNIKEKLSPESQKLVEQITEKAVKSYDLFKNKDGLNTYNFFQTNPSKHFPHGNILHRFNYFKIPDDIDDTAMIYLTKPHTQEEAKWLQNKLIQHSNEYSKTIRNTFPEYQNLKAYSTWFGKNMYIEFDVCALSNMIYCLLYYGLELDEYGQDSVKYIQQVILSNQYIDQPFRVAHQYARTPLIMYHVMRLMNKFHIPELEICREKLENDILYYLKKDDLSFWDRILLEIAHGGKNKNVVKQFHLGLNLHDVKEFPFFIAGFLTAYENSLLYKLASSPLFHIQWTCEAHCLALLAERMVISKT
ncbi:MAG: hypothetical protein U5N85_03825 [Arcicella sp.]|nr:hypothetical protein [Arcicella sp.]